MTKPIHRHRSSRRAPAGRLVLIVVVLATSLGFTGASTARAWDFVYGDAGPDDYSRYMDVALAPDGSSFVAGFYSGNFRGLSSPAAYRYFIEKVSATGAVAWTKEIPTATLSTFSIPQRPQVVVDGLGNVVVEAIDSLYAYASDGSLVSSVVLPPQGSAGDNGPGGNTAAVATGGIVVTSDKGQMLRRYSPTLQLLWTFDATTYVDPYTKSGVVAQADGTFWFVGNKMRTLPTQSDATALIHIAADGTKIAAIKQFGFLTENMTGPNPILGASDNWIIVTGYVPNGSGGYNVKVFSTVDGSYLGEMPNRHPSHPFAAATGTADCGGTDLVFEDRLDPTATGDYTRTTMRRMLMNGTRLVTLAYCAVRGSTMPAPFVISYAISPVAANALTFLTARQLAATTTMEGMSANDLGDQVVAGSSTSSVVYVGAARSFTEVVSTQQRALAAKNPLGSLFYGLRVPGSVLELKLGGRLNVPIDSAGVALAITAIGAKKSGAIKVYPCGATRTSAVTLQYRAGVTATASTVARLGKGGRVCVYTSQATHLAIDLAGQFPAGGTYSGRNPVRFLESRTGVPATFDGKASGLGPRAANTVTVVPITGRGAIPANATSAAITLHALSPRASGSLYAYPCGSPVPAMPNLTFVTGVDRTASALVRLGTGGTICVRTTAATHVALDLSGHLLGNATTVGYNARRLIDTRASSPTTFDGKFWRIGERAAKTTTQLQVTGRASIPLTATSVVLTVTAYTPRSAGAVTVYPCGTTLPNAPNLVVTAGATTTGTFPVKIGTGGKVCIHTTAATHLAAHATGHFLGTTAYNPRPKQFRAVDTRAR